MAPNIRKASLILITTVSIFTFAAAAAAAEPENKKPIPPIKPEGISADIFQKYDDQPYKFRHFGKPGEVIKGNVVALNNTKNKITFKLDAVDEFTNEKGDNYFKTSQDEKTGISKHYFFPEKAVDVEPNFYKLIPYEIRIPKDFAEQEYRSGISVLQEGSAGKGPIQQNIRIVLSNSTFISNNQVIPKQFSWKNLPLTYTYVSISIILVLFYNLYLFAEKLKSSNQAK